MQKVSALDFDNYRSFLKTVLSDQIRKNPSFSLRALARLTGMSPSHLSRALNGQKSISAAAAHQISMALGQTTEESDHLIGLIELERAGNDIHRGRILKRMSAKARPNSRVLSLEAFRVISDWYHFAIVALTNTRGFRAETSWIARRLKIRPLDAELAVERLLTLGLIEKTGKTFRAVNDAEVSTTDDLGSAAIKENHSQHMTRAQAALHDVPVALREFNNLTICMSLADVPKAKTMIRDFIEKFNREMKARPGQEVFQLNVQYYPLSDSERTRP